jgi:TRAP-type C4-dicarboxylate transport system permease small subunit
MRKFLDGLYLASGWLGAFFIAAICTLVVAQVCLNLIDRVSGLLTGTAIGLTIPSYADFTGFFLAAASFLALAHTLRQGAHIRVTLFISYLPEKIARLMEFWCIGVAAPISIYFSWYTAQLVMESYQFHDLSSGMIAVPLWIPQTAMFIGLVILSISLVDEFIGLIRGQRPTYQYSDSEVVSE